MTDAPNDNQQPATMDGPLPKPTDDPLVAKADALFIEHYDRIHDLAVKQHWRLHGHTKDEAIQETLAFTMKAFRDLTQRGADPEMLLPNVVRFAGKRWYDHARFAGNLSAKDALSRKGRRRNGHFVTSLPHSDEDEVAGEVRDAMRARAAGPAEQAILKADYEAFLDSLPPKQRKVTEALEAGLSMSEIAEQRGVSNAAVQDCRKTVARKWTERQGYEESLER
jgi:DNA-directed RNA polymerase specialized sigma24 family protein